jgi:cytochrome c551/c552
MEKGCADCHAVYGRGVGGVKPKGGPDLGKRDVSGTRLELAATMWNHFPDMLKKVSRTGREFPTFTEDEVSDLITFMSLIKYLGEPGNERSGRKLLGEKKCRACHQFGGKGGDIGPDFTQNEEYLSPLALAVALWNHGPDMEDLFAENDIDRPEFSGNQIVDLAAGIRSYMSPTRIPDEEFEPGDPENGRVLASQKGCTHCHGSSQLDAYPVEAFSDMTLDASLTEIAGMMWNHGPDMWEAMESEGLSFPELTMGEMSDLAAYMYIAAHEDPMGDGARGYDLVYEKGCVSCHAIKGQGGGLGPDLTEMDGLETPFTMVARMWNHAEDMDQAVREAKKKWPEFEGQDLADLHACIKTLSPTVDE